MMPVKTTDVKIKIQNCGCILKYDSVELLLGPTGSTARRFELNIV